jgi:uncharacterized protein YkwD
VSRAATSRRSISATMLVALSASLAACTSARPAPPPAAASQLFEIEAAQGSYGPEPAVSLSPAEAELLETARARLAGGGGRPRSSGSLTLAARILARHAAAGAQDPIDRAAVRDALALALSYDPAPAAFLVRGSSGRLRDILLKAMGDDEATHVGVGVAEAGAGAVAVVLASQRRARLDRFPREVASGSSVVLSGELGAELHGPRVFATFPSGRVREFEAAGTGTFRSSVTFAERGRYLLEVVADGPDGPAVAALLAVAAGGATVTAPVSPAAGDPADPAEIEARVAAELSALRARQGLPPLAFSAELAQVARRHSEAMRAAGKVSHLEPGDSGAGDRLMRAGIPYRRVYENVAAARTAIAAHEAAAESPAHLRNMLEPGVVRVGVGVAQEKLASGDPLVYLTEILVEPAEGARDSRLTLDARVRQALWKERARLGLPPLVADVALDDLAREGAVELRSLDARERLDLAPRALALGRGLAAVDAYVASVPEEATRSLNLENARFRRVGVGVVEGASRRFGAGRLFIAVVYTD